MIEYIKIMVMYAIKGVLMLPFAISALIILEKLTVKKRRR